MMGVAVVAEDTLYRGYAFVVLRDRRGAAFAVVVTSLAYALLTPAPGVALQLWAFAFALVLAALRVWRDSLVPVAVAHVGVALTPKLVAALAR